jgi:DNA invertase Pin-like site-specific DNA recombinase
MANKFMLHIMAAVAENEREMISQRTKAALQAAKARGVKLGGDRGYRPSVAPDASKATVVRKAKADQAAHSILPTVQRLQAEELSLNGIANKLNEMGHKTPRDGAWTATAVKRVLARVA